MGTDYNVAIKLSTIGADQTASGLRLAGSGLDSLKSSAESLYGSLLRLAGFGGFIEGLKKIAGAGIEANVELNRNQLQLAAMVQTFNLAGGAAIDYSTALDIASGVQEQLRNVAFATGTSIDGLRESFVNLYPAATAAGLSQEQTIQLMGTLALTAKATGGNVDELTSTMSRLMLGMGATRSEFGRLLLSMGVNQTTMAQWEAAGTVFGNITGRLKEFNALAPMAQASWGGALANIKNAMHELAEVSFEPLYTQLKLTFGEATRLFGTMGAGGTFTFDPELLRRIQSFATGLTNALPAVVSMAGGLLDMGSAVVKASGEFISAFSPLLTLVGNVLHMLSPLIDTFGSWVAITWVAVSAAGSLATAGAALVTGLEALSGALMVAMGATGTLSAGFALILSPIGLAAAAVAALAVGIYAYTAAVAKNEESMASSADTTSRWTLYMDAERASAKYAQEGNTALAAAFEKLGLSVINGQMPLDKAIIAFHDLRVNLDAAALSGKTPPADPAVLEAIADATGKINDQIRALAFTGISGKIADATTQVNTEIAKLNRQLQKTADPETRALIGTQVEALRALLSAKTQSILEEAAVADEKRLGEVKKSWGAVYLATQGGIDLEVGKIQQGYADEQTASDDRIAAAARDAQSFNKIKDEEASKMIAAAQVAAFGVADAYQKLERDTKDFKYGFDSEVLKSNGDDYDAEVRAIGHQLESDFQSLGDRFGGLLYAPIDLVFGAQGKFNAAMRAARIKHGEETAAMTGDWSDYEAGLERQVAHGQITMAGFFAALGTAQETWATTADSGWTASWHKLLGTVQTTGQGIATFFDGLWTNLDTAMQSGFLDIMTGKFGDFRDVLKTLWGSILKDFSGLLASMVKQWMLSPFMKSGSFSIDPSGAMGGGEGFSVGQFGSGGGSSLLGGLFSGQGWMGLLSSGMLGYGIGGAIGGGGIGNQIGGALGGLGGAALGAAIGTGIVPIIGTIVGAVIGAVIGGLFNKNTEQNIGPFSGNGISGTTQDANGQALFQQYGKTLGSLGDIMTAGGGSARSIFDYFGAGDSEFLHSTGATIHAGSAQDLSSDFQQYLTNYFPQTLLSMAFGQKPTGGYQNLPGVSGVPAFDPNTFNPDAPIPKMLAGLGFTAKTIGQISSQIEVRSADDFTAWLSKLVTVVKGFNDLGKDLGKSTSDWFSSFATAATASPADAFASAATNIEDMASSLGMYMGDDQLNRAQQILQLGQQYRDQQVAYLQQLYNLQQQISDAMGGQVRSMKMDLMNPDQKSKFLQAEISTLMGQIGTASTPGALSAIWQAISGDVSGIWSIAGQGGTQTAAGEQWLESMLKAAQDAIDARTKQLGDAALAPNAALNAAITKASELFTDMGPIVTGNSTATVTNTAVVAANTTAVTGSTTAVNLFKTAITAAKDAAIAFATTVGSSGSGGSGPTGVIALLRQQPGLLKTGTGR